MQALHDAVTAAIERAESGDLAGAEALVREVLSCAPRHAGALHVLGVLARKTERYELAIESLRAALDAGSQQAATWFELGAAHSSARQPLEAIAAFEEALRLDPQWHEAVVNIGALLDRLDRHAEAWPWCRRAVEMRPECDVARMNLGNVLRALGRVDEAIVEFEAATRLAPRETRYLWNLAIARLLAGDFARGWDDFEARDESGEVVLDRYPQPRWRGEPLVGKTILVHAEQGLGDEVLFATCLPDLLRLGGRVALTCDPRLAPLLARSFPQVAVHGVARRLDRAPANLPGQYDYQIPCGSLPRFFRRRREDFPRQERLLRAAPQAVGAWRQRLAELGPGLKVGISWKAGGQPVSRRRRTTTLADWQGLLAEPGVVWVNLQYGEAADEIQWARRELGATIHDWSDADPLVDLDAFAAKLAALDLVISVGNATVHLAGALGVTTWALVPRVPGWRWLLSGEQSPWYAAVRIVRQPELDDWDSVFRQVGRLLRQRLGRDAQPTPTPPAPLAAAPRVAVQPGLEHLTDARGRIDEALDLYRRDELQAAARICREVVEHAPRSAAALQLWGVIAHRSGQLDLALRCLARAAAVTPDDATLRANLGAALADAGRSDEALSHLARAVELAPELDEARARWASLLQQAGRHAEALPLLQAAVARQPRDAKLSNALGVALLAGGQPAEAAAALRQAVGLRPDYAAAYNNLGQALEALGQADQAARCYQRVLEIEPRNLTAIGNLAALMDRLRQPDTAIRFYLQALAVEPSSVATLKRLGMLLHERRRFDEALTVYERALALQPHLRGLRMHREAARRMAAAARRAGTN